MSTIWNQTGPGIMKSLKHGGKVTIGSDGHDDDGDDDYEIDDDDDGDYYGNDDCYVGDNDDERSVHFISLITLHQICGLPLVFS